MYVYIVRSEENRDYDINGVFINLESAIKGIKKQYCSPYIIEWDNPETNGDDFVLIGHFKEVPGLSTCHTTVFYIDTWEVKGE